jgi:ribosome-associated toxin RatA of RatAB toxin-antitoxin module
MSKIHVEESTIINARAETLYGIVADYEVGHPAILPKPMDGLRVDKGGQGLGTELTVFVNVMGSKTSFRQRVTKSEPFTLIEESNIDNDLVTRFYFDALPDGKTKVTISTDFTPQNFVERLLNPMLMYSMYKRELRNLEAYAIQKEQSPVTA